ncbi:hypothetical protein [Devosia sp. DBB001]|nr:hypothetical protein [Devosia sp. DBB001]
MAALLMRGGADYSPVQHWAQGLARAAQGIVGGLESRWADEAETAGLEGARSKYGGEISRLLGGGSNQEAAINPIAAALAGTGSDAVSSPGGDQAGIIRQGLIDRGLPEHVADAFMLNFRDESALDPSVNEASPLVPGSRGGYGLAQWTGDRRNALEQFAAGRNANVADPNVQLDFLMQELQGPEAKAYQAIMSAPDTNQAAAAIVNQFLRPAEANRARREAAYLGGAAPVRVAQGISPAVLEAMSDPWAKQAYGPVLDALVSQQMRQMDPAYQQGLEKGQLEIDALRNPPPAKPIEVGGVLLDPTTYQPIFDSRKPDPGFHLLSPDEVSANRLDPNKAWQVGPDNRVYEVGGGGVNVNLPGQPNIGTIPPGYAATQDQNGAWTMAPIPGSPAAIEAEQANAKADLAQEQKAITSDTIVSQAQQARALMGPASTGWGAALFGQLPVGQAADLQRHVSSLKAIASSENLNAMRQASPTGGALGNASDADIKLLQDKAGALDPKSEQFPTQLDDYERTLLRIVHGQKVGDAIYDQTRAAQGTTPGQTTSNGVKWSIVP